MTTTTAIQPFDIQYVENKVIEYLPNKPPLLHEDTTYSQPLFVIAFPQFQAARQAPVPSREALVLRERLKAKLPEAIRRAQEYRMANGNPVHNLAQLLAIVTGEPERWREIVDEPYG